MFKVKKTRPKLHVVVRASRELALAFALGGVPVLLNSESSAQFKAMLDLLLAAPFFDGLLRMAVFSIRGGCNC